jgi:hypothetical protein
MTRADAIRVLTDYRTELNTAMDGDELNPVLSALDMAIAALRCPVPDPSTGLVRCGCGGVAKLYHRHSTILPKQILWVVRCVKFGKCGISTPDCTRKQDAIALWNLAMSGQTADRNAAKVWNESVPKPGVTVQVSDNPGCKTADSAETSPGGCNWCGPGRIGWFSVQFWVRACYGKRKWMSVTQDWKKKVKYCPMCGRKLDENDKD